MLITDPLLVSLGLVEGVVDSIRSGGIQVTVFDGGVVEPSTDTVASAARAAADAAPDLFVGVGGGSNLDLAKLTCAVNSHGGSPTDYLGCDNVPGPLKPLYCVPTTSGTGSEVSHSAVICDSRCGRKTSALSPYLRPAVAVVDPELTLSCPKRLTAESGIDALTHAIEAYLATSFNGFDESPAGFLPYEGNHPAGDVFAEKAIRLVGEHFERAVHTPQDLEARSGMALASTFGGIAFSQCGVALAHALEYPVGNAYECSHGIGNGILLPEVMRYLKPVRQERLADIAGLLGAGGGEPQADAEAAIGEVERLRSAAELPCRLSEVGGRREDLPGFAANAMQLTRLIDLTARRPNEGDLLAILEASF